MASLDPQGEIVPKELPNPEEAQIWEGENGTFPPTFTFAASARLYCRLYLTNTVDATVTVWLTSQKNPNPETFLTTQVACYPSLRKQPTFGDAITGFTAKWRLRNERRNSILMTRHHSHLGSASDWLNQIPHAARPIRSTTQIWVATRHQYGISVLVSQKSIGEETSGSVVKCRLFSQASVIRNSCKSYSLIHERQKRQIPKLSRANWVKIAKLIFVAFNKGAEMSAKRASQAHSDQALSSIASLYATPLDLTDVSRPPEHTHTPFSNFPLSKFSPYKYSQKQPKNNPTQKA